MMLELNLWYLLRFKTSAGLYMSNKNIQASNRELSVCVHECQRTPVCACACMKRWMMVEQGGGGHVAKMVDRVVGCKQWMNVGWRRMGYKVSWEELTNEILLVIVSESVSCVHKGLAGGKPWFLFGCSVCGHCEQGRPLHVTQILWTESRSSVWPIQTPLHRIDLSLTWL